MARKNSIYNGLYIFLTICIVLIILWVCFTFKLWNGAFNYDYIAECKQQINEKFCGLEIIDLSIPLDLKNLILSQVTKGEGKRVTLPGWKSGRTIPTNTVIKNIPQVYDWYTHLETYISNIIGEKVYITSDQLPTTCAVLIYEENNDFINWHYDVNYFNGRFFTLLIPVTVSNSCTKFTYIDKDGNTIAIKDEMGKAILFEGNKVFHMATPFCNKGEKRIILSVQFSTNPTISFYNKMLMYIKDSAYIGFKF
jgi:hypothetical protein